MLTRSLAILTAVSFALTLWRWIVSLRFPLHRRIAVQTSLPGVTLLKPLKGCDAETKNCLRSWFLQEYPGPVQILFGVASAEDSVRPIVRELLAEFPNVEARLIVCAENLGANAKVSTLRQLEPHGRHELLMISDADVRVPPDFAVNVAPLLADPAVGLVNCFYRLANPSTVAMQWEAVAINADFWTQVLQSRSLRPVDFALGAVMTLPAAQLKAIGGFATLADFLADDYQLGRQIARQKKRIEFATVVAECCDPPMTWAAVWAHQSRWARTIRVCQPAPFFLSVLNNATLWPLLLLLDTRRPLALCAAAACVAFRIVTASRQQSRLTQSRRHAVFWWMAPVKDLLDALLWAAAFAGNQIVWRGDRHRILPGGKLQKV
ncbi:MAG TPA: glycosyltransferase [Candidatus Saccharimonadales bacterium]|nr:glycosyltransferase [Candidatus Saccharimonadales bacterium]